MTITVDASDVSVSDEDGVLVIALSGPSDSDDDFYLMVQHTDEVTEQDRKLGMVGPYIELCNQGWLWYGHIDRFELRRNFVQVQMDAHVANEMGNDGNFEVRFALNESEFAQLRASLKRAFEGQAYFSEYF